MAVAGKTHGCLAVFLLAGMASVQEKRIGISTKDLPFIFERFYRAGASNNGGPHQSGGLGLAIAKAVVEVLGGSIECQSTPGRGSTFTVSLPSSAAPAGIPA
jgi:two-component system sensor histidine kinase BaeS